MTECTPPVFSSFTSSRRERLAARALRAGCGVLRVSNSMQELFALACISKTAREARALALQPAAKADRATFSWERIDATLPENPEAREVQELAEPDLALWDAALRTTGQVVRRKS